MPGNLLTCGLHGRGEGQQSRAGMADLGFNNGVCALIDYCYASEGENAAHGWEGVYLPEVSL